ncbi:MAG: hypothetical protein NTZ80_00695 [Patescibacteria group bacterium]|nr:hypothetical protein [Patescibacteria group bacterium]
MTDITKNVLARIKSKGIFPRSCWYFWLRHTLAWIAISIYIILSCIAFGIIIFQIVDADWDLYEYLASNLLSFVTLILPYLWILIMIIVSFLVCYYFRHTKKGYRYNILIVILASFALSVIGGGILYVSGFSEKIDTELNEELDWYERLHQFRHKPWMMPQKGFLYGKVINMKGDRIVINTPIGDRWVVAPPIDFQNRLCEGKMIKLRGHMIGSGAFAADEIRFHEGFRHLPPPPLEDFESIESMKENIPIMRIK